MKTKHKEIGSRKKHTHIKYNINKFKASMIDTKDIKLYEDIKLRKEDIDFIIQKHILYTFV